MAKIKYDVKGVDPGGDRKLPKPNVYRCKVLSCVDAKPSGKDRRLEVQYQITEGESKGFILYDYINLESEAAQWKLAQFVKAMGLKASGSLDPEELVGTALSVRVRIDPGNDQYAASARPATLLPLDADEDEEGDADLDDDEDVEDDEDDADEDGEDEAYTEEDLEAMSNDELKEAAEELEVDVPKRLTAAGKKKLIAAILEAQGEDDEDEEGDEEDEEYTWEEIDSMTFDELVQTIEENELDIETTTEKKVRGKTKEVKRSEEDLKSEIAEALEVEIPADEGDDEEGDDDDDDDAPDYDSMDLDELRKLAKERKLSPKGSKAILVKRLQKDDEPF